MSTEPEVTVVIPTRNRRSLLAAHALPTALGQEDVAIEVVVVDDASEDGTAELVTELGDDRIRLLRLPQPTGPAGARNRGAAAAGAPWLAFLDDDDLWAPQKLRTQLDAAGATGADWVYSRAVIVDEHLTVLRAPVSPDPGELAATLLAGNRIWGGPSAVLVRAGRFRDAGGFDESLWCFEDWDLWLTLASSGRAAACEEALVAHVEHAGSAALREPADILAQHERMLAKHRAVTGDDRRHVLEWLAGEHAQAGRRGTAARLYLAAAVRHRSPGNLAAALGALFGEAGLRRAAALHLAVRGRTHLDAGSRPVDLDLPWLVRRRAAAA